MLSQMEHLRAASICDDLLDRTDDELGYLFPDESDIRPILQAMREHHQQLGYQHDVG